MNDPRQTAMADFIRRAGWAEAEVRPLSGDASNRRYLRLHRAGGTAVLMDAPPDRGEDVRPFLAMTGWLRSLGLSAPEMLAEDIKHGFLLLEDLGDRLFAMHLAREPGDETDLYRRATELLVYLAECPAPGEIGTGAARQRIAPYDDAVLDREAGLLCEWWLPAATGREFSPAMAADYRALVRMVTEPVRGAREAVVLRDYHAENLLCLPDRPGHAAIGLLDYQDVLAGHPAYDLVSLLEDARRDTSRELQAAMLDIYLAARPGLDAETFRRAYAVLGAQRNLKIIGIFTRLAVRDGKPGYLRMIPRVWRHLQRDLAHPGLTGLAGWIARHVPAPEPAVLDRIAGQVSA